MIQLHSPRAFPVSRKNSIGEKGWCHAGEDQGEEVQPIETLKNYLIIDFYFLDQMFSKSERKYVSPNSFRAVWNGFPCHAPKGFLSEKVLANPMQIGFYFWGKYRFTFYIWNCRQYKKYSIPPFQNLCMKKLAKSLLPVQWWRWWKLWRWWFFKFNLM